MRKFIVFFLIISAYPLFSQNSNGLNFKSIDSAKFVATYSLKYKLDSLNLDKVRDQEMWLFLGKNTSYFVSKSHHLDTEAISKLKTHAELQSWLDNYGPYKFRSLYRIYKNYPKGKITFTEITASGTFKIEESVDLFYWKLTQDTATIGGYYTQKATCDFGGRKWIAWFSPDLPFNDGPYKFNGLAGLIVKVYDSREHYVFELTGIEIADSDLMIEFNDYPYINTTKQKYFQAREAMRNSIANIVKQRGGDSDSQQFVAKRMAARNNYIELK